MKSQETKIPINENLNGTKELNGKYFLSSSAITAILYDIAFSSGDFAMLGQLKFLLGVKTTLRKYTWNCLVIAAIVALN